jgi:ethanolamine transporter EutH
LKNKSLMVVPIAALLAAMYWWQPVLTVLLGMVKLVFGMILYNLLRVVILAVLLVFVVRYGGYWPWRKLTGREA